MRLLVFSAVMMMAASAWSEDPFCLTGWDIRDRAGPDSAGYTMVSPAKVIACDGFLSEWSYQAKRSHPFRAIVWRQVGNSPTQFQIVGINDIPAGATDSEVTYQVPANERIAVKTGDVIGWSFGEGVLTWNSGGGTRVLWVGENLPASLVETQKRNFNGGSGDREYSIDAKVENTETEVCRDHYGWCPEDKALCPWDENTAKNCPKTCGVCGGNTTDCVDMEPCPYYEVGYCMKYLEVAFGCPNKCGFCVDNPDCIDLHAKCPSMKGLCHGDERYAKVCPKTCGKC